MKAFALAMILGLAAAPVFATPVDDARAHFAAIAQNDGATLAGQYAPDAHLEWVGGPLNGRYDGVDKIREVWAKFAKNEPYQLAVGRIEESANDQGATVTADVAFKGKNTIEVRYVLVYRGGRISSEVWQIDPKLSVAAPAGPGY